MYMDSRKVGQLICQLRKEKQMTQQQLADRLHVSNKTVSKWECGQGCPDAGLWTELASVLGADIPKLFRGELLRNKPDVGRIDRIRFYVCPDCGNILTSTGECSVSCCGRSLEPLVPQSPDEEHEVRIEKIEMEAYVTVEHPMRKAHYISFAACVHDDRVTLVRLYPEGSSSFYLPMMRRGGQLYFYCTDHGLMRCPFKI